MVFKTKLFIVILCSILVIIIPVSVTYGEDILAIQFDKDSQLADSFVTLKPQANPLLKGRPITNLTLCFRIYLMSVRQQYILHSDGMVLFNIRYSTIKYGLIGFKNEDVIFMNPQNLEFVPQTWYHICMGYLDHKVNPKISAVINGKIVLNDTIKSLATRKFKSNSYENIVNDQFLVGRWPQT